MEPTTPPAPPAATPATSEIPQANLATSEGVTGNKPEAPAATPAETKAEPKPEEKAVSSRFAELARKEKALTQQRMKLSQQAEEVTKKQAEMAEFQRAFENAKRNPAAHLKKLYGDDWFGLLSKLYTDGVPPAQLALEAVDEKLAAFERQQKETQEAAQKAAQEAKANEEKQARASFAAECKAFVDTHPDDYELIRLNNSHLLVPQLIEAEYGRTGKLLTAKQASDAVEEYLVAQAEKAAATKKLQSKLQPQAKRTPAATLSNDMAASSPVSKPPPRSLDERFARAAAVMEEVQRQKA